MSNSKPIKKKIKPIKAWAVERGFDSIMDDSLGIPGEYVWSIFRTKQGATNYRNVVAMRSNKVIPVLISPL